jgi:hypothetical protein
MKQNSSFSEHDQLASVAEQYRARGYTVTVQPSAGERPEFLRDLEPDLVASGFGEHLVIEVKSPRVRADSESFRRLSDAIKRQKGWRLVIVAPPPQQDLLPGQSLAPASVAELRKRVQEARELDRLGMKASAFVTAWSATEGILRYLLETEQVPVERPGTLSLLRIVASLGVVDEDQYRQLLDLYRHRSAFVHGFEARETKEHPEKLEWLLGVAEGIIANYERSGADG